MAKDTLATRADGRLTRNGSTYDIVFERRLKQSIEKVWAAITVPERIADWFTPVSFDPDLRLGARVSISFGPGDTVVAEVVALDPPRVFAYRELQPGGQNPVLRFELEPDGSGTRLVFSQSGLGGKAREGVAINSAGWHEFLDALEGVVAGGAPARVDEDDGHGLRARYKAAVDWTWGSDDPDGAVRRRDDGGFEIVFRRRIRRPVEKVWAALTTPERLADWLAAASIEPDLRVGARFTLRFAANEYRMAGEIVELDPPRLIAWTWPDAAQPGAAPGVVRFELARDGDGCILTLTDGGAGMIHPNQAAGWHTHLEGLASAADGVFTAWDREVEAVHEARYRAAIARL
jgi:uncharacterized protein YndB with AHSA1/START domain